MYIYVLFLKSSEREIGLQQIVGLEMETKNKKAMAGVRSSFRITLKLSFISLNLPH